MKIELDHNKIIYNYIYKLLKSELRDDQLLLSTSVGVVTENVFETDVYICWFPKLLYSEQAIIDAWALKWPLK